MQSSIPHPMAIPWCKHPLDSWSNCFTFKLFSGSFLFPYKPIFSIIMIKQAFFLLWPLRTLETHCKSHVALFFRPIPPCFLIVGNILRISRGSVLLTYRGSVYRRGRRYRDSQQGPSPKDLVCHAYEVRFLSYIVGEGHCKFYIWTETWPALKEWALGDGVAAIEAEGMKA